MKRRVLALFLVLALSVCLTPMAFAAVGEPTAEPEEIAEVIEETPTEEEPAELMDLTEIELIPEEEGAGESNTNQSTLELKVEEPAKESYNAGDVIVLTVSISNTGTAAPVGLDITFDFDGFTVKSAEVTGTNVNGAFSESGDHLLTLSYESGESGGVTAKVLSGPIATITLVTPRQTESKTKTYTFAATVKGALNIEEQTVAFAATTVQKEVTVNEATSLRGDANSDSEVDLADVMAIRWNMIDEDEYPLDDAVAADVDSDGEITLVDVMAIRWYMIDEDWSWVEDLVG